MALVHSRASNNHKSECKYMKFDTTNTVLCYERISCAAIFFHIIKYNKNNDDDNNNIHIFSQIQKYPYLVQT